MSGGDVADSSAVRPPTSNRPASADVRVTPSAASRGASALASGDARRRRRPRRARCSSIEVSARMRPWPIISRCSATSCISLIRCDDRSTVRPSWASSVTRARIRWMPSRSRPLTGSSETEDSRVGQQRRGDAQALAHPQRERAGGLVGHFGEADPVRITSSTRRGPMPTVAPRASRWLRALRLLSTAPASSSAPTSAGAGRVSCGSAVDQGGSGSRPVQAEDHPHRRRLSGSVGAEEAGDYARPDGGADAVDGELTARRCAEVAVALGELLQLGDLVLPTGSFGASCLRNRSP